MLPYCENVTLQHATDNNGKTALSLCENIEEPDWQATCSLLHNAMAKPVRSSFLFVDYNGHCNTFSYCFFCQHDCTTYLLNVSNYELRINQPL